MSSLIEMNGHEQNAKNEGYLEEFLPAYENSRRTCYDRRINSETPAERDYWICVERFCYCILRPFIISTGD